MLTQNYPSAHKQSQKQFNQIAETQNEQEQSIIEWVRQSFAQSFTNCKKVHNIQNLFNGMAIAEIVSFYLNENDKEIFLNQIEVIEKIQNSEDAEIAANNLNASLIQIRDLFSRALRNMKKHVNFSSSSENLKQMVEFSLQYIQNLNAQSLVGSKNKMKNFMIQVIMILPEISSYFQSNTKVNQTFKAQKLNNKENMQSGSILSQNKEKLEKNQTKSRISSTKKKSSTQMKELYNETETGQFFTNNINELSSIMGYSTVNYASHKQDKKPHKQNPKPQALSNKSQQEQDVQNDLEDQVQDFKRGEDQVLFENKVERLLNWMHSAYNLDLSAFLQPHILLGELINCVFSPNRLKDNEKPIKPTHYQLGSYSVYKKALDFLTNVERLNKNNLIKLMKEVEVGKVNEVTFWSLVEDIYLMVKNKISQPLKIVNKKPPKPQSVKNPTQQSQKLPTLYDENIDIENIRNQSVTDILRKQSEENRRPNELKDAPLYCQEVIKQTQLWLQNEMGMSHPLSKSRPQSKALILQNPLLNGTLYAKIIQRLKIGSAKGIITPLQKKQLKNNIGIIKKQLLNRGYECARKLNIYKPTYNFYIGLLSQIREIYESKQTNTKKLIINDRQKRQIYEQQMEIPEQEKLELIQWLTKEFHFKFNQSDITLSLKQMKQVIEGVVNINFLKQTTGKIRYSNYVKLFDFFRSIGFSHYSTIKIEDLLNDNHSCRKKTQNLRWLVLRDLKIIKGQK